jgi:hypothetical protein
MGEDAAASLETLRQAAGESSAEVQRSAEDALGRIEDWMRKQSAPDEHDSVRV